MTFIWRSLHLPQCLILFIICLIKGHQGLAIRSLEVPNSVPRGSPVLMYCDFEESNLYSIKWYKNYVEFYRYVPSNAIRPAQEFKLSGVYIELSLSNLTHVYMSRTDLDSEGVYSCEVSSEAPFFRTVKAEKRMKVYVLPSPDNLRLTSKSHVITGHLNDLQVNSSMGDQLQLTCETGLSSPEMQLSWLINELPAPRYLVSEHKINRVSPGPLMLSRSTLQLQTSGEWADHWWPSMGEWIRLRIKCISRLMLKYEHSSVETLSAGQHGTRKYFYVNKDWFGPKREHSPLIQFEANAAQFELGDYLHVNCSSNLTRAQLSWLVNDQEVNTEHLIAYHVNFDQHVLLLTLQIDAQLLDSNSDLRLECRATTFETVANFQAKLTVNARHPLDILAQRDKAIGRIVENDSKDDYVKKNRRRKKPSDPPLLDLFNQLDYESDDNHDMRQFSVRNQVSAHSLRNHAVCLVTSCWWFGSTVITQFIKHIFPR